MAPRISVVIPVYNEADNLEDLHRELTVSLLSLGEPYEIVIVDDGSRDATPERLLAIEAADPRVRVLRLRRNFGQTAAFSAGFDHARGEVIVTSDGDLQNDPADIPALVAKLDEGYDMVCGWRRQRRDPVSKKVPSWFANRIISAATGVHLHFIPAVASWMGVTLAEVPVNHRRRTRGRSKYGLGRTLRVLLDLFTVKFLLAYGTRPAHLFGLWGLASGGLGFLILAYLTYIRLFEDTAIAGRPLLLLGVLLMVTGLVMVATGLLAEMLVRIYHESQGKPTYVVKEMTPSAVPRERERARPAR
jgi:glycosyltransferase involved in cell wall biosynthesis